MNYKNHPILNKKGVSNYQLNFNSANSDYANLGNTIINGAKAVGLWFSPSTEINASSGNFYNPLISRVNLDGTRDHDFSIQFSNGRVAFENRNSGGTPNIAYSNAQTFLAGTWYHLFCQIDARMDIYINGNSSGLGFGYSGAIGTEGNNLNLGGLLRDARRFHGRIKQVSIWGNPRTGTEITNEQNNWLTGLETDLLAAYPVIKTGADTFEGLKGNTGTIHTNNVGGSTYIENNVFEIIT